MNNYYWLCYWSAQRHSERYGTSNVYLWRFRTLLWAYTNTNIQTPAGVHYSSNTWIRLKLIKLHEKKSFHSFCKVCLNKCAPGTHSWTPSSHMLIDVKIYWPTETILQRTLIYSFILWIFLLTYVYVLLNWIVSEVKFNWRKDTNVSISTQRRKKFLFGILRIFNSFQNHITKFNYFFITKY